MRCLIGEDKKIVICAGKIGHDTLVFLKKKGYSKHPDYKIEDIIPQYFYFRTDGLYVRTMHTTLNMMSRCLEVALTNFEYSTKPTPQDAFDLVYSKFASMTEVERLTAKGRVKSIPAKERTKEQGIFLSCYEDLMLSLY